MPSNKKDKEEKSKKDDKENSKKDKDKSGKDKDDKKEIAHLTSKDFSGFEHRGENQAEPINLAEGDMIADFKVISPLEVEGGMNIDYVVEHKKKKDLYALKLERHSDKNPHLRVELFILLHMEKAGGSGKHFRKLFEKGQNKEFVWIAITLCGRTLRELRKGSKDQRFSIGCAISVGMQCLKAIEILHSMGFLHRDVNPNRFAAGRPEIKEQRLIYCLDFGFAHQFKTSDGKMKPPRENPWKFKGSLRHSSRNAYLGKELCRGDDVEMWFYMVIEMAKGSLPWMNQKDPKEVYDWQKSCRTPYGERELLGGLPTEFVQIMKLIDKCDYLDEPKYKEIFGLLGNAIVMSGANEYPYDWENEEKKEGGGEKKEEKKKEEEKEK